MRKWAICYTPSMSLLLRTVRFSFWSFAIVAVSLLAPSAGLITLTVPDEPSSSAINIPDSPHIGKRASDDAQQFAINADAATYVIHPRLAAFGELVIRSTFDRSLELPLLANIRAPPAA